MSLKPATVRVPGEGFAPANHYLPIATHMAALNLARSHYIKHVLNPTESAAMDDERRDKEAENYAELYWQMFVDEGHQLVGAIYVMMKAFDKVGIPHDKFFTGSPMFDPDLKAMIEKAGEPGGIRSAYPQGTAFREKVSGARVDRSGTTVVRPGSQGHTLADKVFEVINGNETKKDVLEALELLASSSEPAQATFMRLIAKSIEDNRPIAIPGHGFITKYVEKTDAPAEPQKTGTSD